MTLSSEASLKHLAAILRDRQLPSTRDDIEWAFQSPGTRESVVGWVHDDLGPDRLLTREEAELYSKLQLKCIARDIEANVDLAGIAPVQDSQLGAAITALEQSTAAIDRHTRTLQKQQEALRLLQAKNRDDADDRARTKAQQREKHVSEKQRVTHEIEDLLEDLTSQLAVAQKGIRSRDSSLKSATTEVLKKGDRSLVLLEQAAAKTKPSDRSGGEGESRIEMLRQKLITLLTEGLRCRLDRIYLKHLMTARHEDAVDEADEEIVDHEGEVGALEDEMAVLYSEIAPVAEMSVRQQYLQPILQEYRRAEAKSGGDARSTMEYVTLTLEHMIQALEVLLSYTQRHRSFSAALDVIQSAASKAGLVANPAPSPVPQPRRASLGTAPLLQKPILVDDKNLHLTPPADPLVAAQRLLRNLGLSVDSTFDAADVDTVLSKATSDSKAQLRSLSTRVDDVVLTTTAAQLDHANEALGRLVEQLHAYSPSSKMHLIDQQLEADVSELDWSVNEVGASMATMFLSPSRADEDQKAQFEARWS